MRSAPLTQTNDELTRVLSVIGHELRSPLTVVLGLAEFLQMSDAKISPQLRLEALGDIAGSASRIERLLADLIDIDKDGLGLNHVDRRSVRIDQLIENCVAQAPLIEGRIVEVDAEPLYADIDPEKTERIVENLLFNADKYSPEDRRITIEARRVDHGIEVSVSDRGPGIPNKLMAEIFEPYTRVDDGREIRGYGVGLSIVAGFAALHGGRAWATKRPGGGTCFNVFLPARTRSGNSVPA